jgi:hypothetical protein
MWSMDGTGRHFSSTPPVHAYRLSTSSCKTGMSSCCKFGSAWSRPSSSTRHTMITSTVMYNSRQGSESGFVTCTGRWLHSMSRARASGSWDPSSLVHSRCWTRWAPIAYWLELLTGAKLHDVFYVGLLKPFRGEPPSAPGMLPPIRHGHFCIEPRMVEKSIVARGKLKVLVRWKGLVATEALWMPLEEFRKLYPSFQLADELIVRGGGISWWG